MCALSSDINNTPKNKCPKYERPKQKFTQVILWNMM